MKNKKEPVAYQKNLLSVIVIFISATLVLAGLAFFVRESGLITPGEKNRVKEEELAREKDREFFDITLDTEFYKNGWIAWDGDVYYYMNNIYICQKDQLGDELLEINRDNIIMRDGQITYHVKNGDKYKFGNHGKIYRCRFDNDIIIYKGISEYEYKYDNPPFYPSDYAVYIKSNQIREYGNSVESVFLKNNNIKKIEIYGKNNFLIVIDDTEKISTVSSGVKPFKKKVDEEVSNHEIYKEVGIRVFLSNGLFYDYTRCSYNEKENMLYIINKAADKGGSAEGLVFTVP